MGNEILEPGDGTESERIVKKSVAKAKRDDGWHFNKSGLMPRINNVVNICKDDHIDNLWLLNEFTGEIEYNEDPPWGGRKGDKLKDSDDTFFLGYLAQKHFFEPPKATLRNAVFLMAADKRIHPIKDYLEGLKWDGKPRLDMWLSKTTGTENNAYIREVGRKVICAAVSRIYIPGSKFDHMMILEGKQRTFKSTMVEILGYPWYSTINVIEDVKTAVETMIGKWFLEMEELAALRRMEVEHVKAFVSRKTDRIRLSYGYRAEDYPRKSVIIGTMNPIGDNQYFRDASGNTRFWPIACDGKLDINWLSKNRDQIFAESMAEVDGRAVWRTEKLFLSSNESMEIANREQEERQQEDTWFEVVENWLINKNVVSPFEIATQAVGLQKDKLNQGHTIRIGIIMRSLGWRTCKRGTRQRKVYVRPGTDINKMEEELKAVEWND